VSWARFQDVLLGHVVGTSYARPIVHCLHLPHQDDSKAWMSGLVSIWSVIQWPTTSTSSIREYVERVDRDATHERSHIHLAILTGGNTSTSRYSRAVTHSPRDTHGRSHIHLAILMGGHPPRDTLLPVAVVPQTPPTKRSLCGISRLGPLVASLSDSANVHPPTAKDNPTDKPSYLTRALYKESHDLETSTVRTQQSPTPTPPTIDASVKAVVCPNHVASVICP
jgi:hypothetical protein